MADSVFEYLDSSHAEVELEGRRSPQLGEVGLPVAANLLASPALKRKAYGLDPNFAS